MIETYREENKSVNFINLAPGLIKTKMQKKIFNTKKNYTSLKKFKLLYKKFNGHARSGCIESN